MFDFDTWYAYSISKLLTHTFTYLTVAGVFYYFFWIRFKSSFEKIKIQPSFPKTNTIKKEIKWSLLNIFCLAIINLSVYFLYKENHSKIYIDISEYGWFYFVVSLPMLMFLQDTYFYWTHRIMHTNFFYEKIHRVHHQFTNPSPWTTLAQHPLEIIPQNLFFVIVLTIIPIHPIILFSFVIVSTGINLMGHLGYELFPRWFVNSWLGKVFLTSTFHNMHHEYQVENFGLYFFFWDRLMGTYKDNYFTRLKKLKKK